MKLSIEGHPYHYEMEALVRMFFHGVPVSVVESLPKEEDNFICTRAISSGGVTTLFVRVRLEGHDVSDTQQLPLDCPGYEAECERMLAVMLYRLLTPLTGVQLQWGILTGIRPVKLVHHARAQGLTDEEIRRNLREQSLVSPQKISLLMETATREAQVLRLSAPNSFSLYISIPFCPTRCQYCSFVSHSVEKAKHLVPEYVELLIREIAYTAQLIKPLGLRLETVYFGGGTPTTLTAQQLRRVMGAVQENFDLSTLREYTVEAGRPDTITEEKLCVLRHFGVTRISINPQTMNDSVLDAIGRKHTTQETLSAFALARKTGHKNINMDLIAGLPTDTYEGFCETLRQVLALEPENITLHTLSVKRAARLTAQDSEHYLAQSALVRSMLHAAANGFAAGAYHPYYLYRQKNTLDNMENVGYCKDGFAGLYNVYIMDETHSIVALGAGGVSKLRAPGGNKIERVFNFKYPYEYNTRFDEILARKNKIANFYREHHANEQKTE